MATSPQLLGDEVCTIFIVGFPEDFTEREFMNMFMFCDGFDACSLKGSPPDDDVSGALSKSLCSLSSEQDVSQKRFLTLFI